MRGTSSGPCSYSPATRDGDAPMPNGGTVTPTCPLPRNGDGARAGSVVASTKAESAAGCAAAARVDAFRVARASTPAKYLRIIRDCSDNVALVGQILLPDGVALLVPASDGPFIACNALPRRGCGGLWNRQRDKASALVVGREPLPYSVASRAWRAAEWGTVRRASVNRR